jgi:selenocysteine lyase/cysteine desulfurase
MIDRRQFVGAGGLLGSLAWVGCAASGRHEEQPALAAEQADFATARDYFPWSRNETYLNNAGMHPSGVHAIRAAEEYLQSVLRGPGHGKSFGERGFDEVRELYGRLIGALPSEIAFVQSTLTGENIVAGGLGLHDGRGNVVTDELHYHGGTYIYRMLEKAGLELRVVPQRDWKLDLEDYRRLIDGKTRLVAMTLVSNLNGYFHDARAVSDLAHEHGAYVYADVVQAAGCVPVDVRAMGIDFCCASTYKWLMGLRGLGLLYVREELQGKVLRRTQFGDRQYGNFEYHYFPGSPPGDAPVTWEPRSGAVMYEVGNVANVAVAALREALVYILTLGVENILAHARPLVTQLAEELPKLGYPCITPAGSPTPIVAFLVGKPEETAVRLKKGNVVAKVKWNQLRISPSVFNNQEDAEELLRALA